MQAVIAELAAEHAREAALLWELWQADPAAEDLRERISAHLDGMLVAAEHGADPLAGLETPWCGADWFPAAWLLARVSRPCWGHPTPMGEDAHATAAIADARRWPGADPPP